MKRNILWAGMLTGMMGAFLPSCGDDGVPFERTELPEEEVTEVVGEKFYLGDGRYGQQNVPVITLGQDVKYPITVVRAGNSITPEETVTLRVLTAGELSAYNTENMTKFTILPEEYYTLTPQLSGFSTEARRQQTEIVFKASIAGIDPEASNYVLPLKLEASDADIDSERGQLILKPVITRPTVRFMGNTDDRISVYKGDLTSGNTSVTSTFTLALDRDNQGWTFGVTFEEDQTVLQSLVEEYNTENSTQYVLLPDECYEYSTVNFTEEESEITLTLTYELANLTVDKTYLLPMKMKECTGMPFGTDEKVVYVPVEVFSIPKITLNNGNVFVLTDSSDGKKDKLFDGNKTTIWQSMWYDGYGTKYSDKVYDSTYGIYIDVTFEKTLTEDLKIGLSLEKFRTSSQNRPKKAAIYGYSNDAWEKLKEIDDVFSEYTKQSKYPCTEEIEISLSKAISKVRIAFLTNFADGTLTNENHNAGTNIRLSELEVWGY